MRRCKGADIGAGLFAIHDVNPESGTYDTECAGRSNMANHHQLDPYPIPKEKSPLFINEPWLLDKTLVEYPRNKEPDEKDDNVRVYVPLDLNREAILRRLNRIIYHYDRNPSRRAFSTPRKHENARYPSNEHFRIKGEPQHIVAWVQRKTTYKGYPQIKSWKFRSMKMSTQPLLFLSNQ